MVSFFKHFAIRIWLTVFLGGLVSIWVLPSFQGRLGLEWALLPVALMMLAVFQLTGWISNRWGLNTVERLIHEAGIFERDGMGTQAEDRFQRAVAVFDSFLISPLVKKAKSPRTDRSCSPILSGARKKELCIRSLFIILPAIEPGR